MCGVLGGDAMEGVGGVRAVANDFRALQLFPFLCLCLLLSVLFSYLSLFNFDAFETLTPTNNSSEYQNKKQN